MSIKIVVILSLLIFCGNVSTQTKISPEVDITKFIERYDNAWKNNDSKAIDHFLAPNYIYFTVKGAIKSRQSMIDTAASPGHTISSVERSEIKVYITDQTAVVSSRWKGQGIFNGKAFNEDQRCSLVLTQDKQGWQVVSEHCTRITAP